MVSFSREYSAREMKNYKENLIYFAIFRWLSENLDFTVIFVNSIFYLRRLICINQGFLRRL